MAKEIIETDKGAALGYEIDLPNAKLMIVEAERGYIACGYLNPDTIEEIGDAAVLIKDVNNIKDMLRKQPFYVSPKARELGINLKMTGKQCINKMIEPKEEDIDKILGDGEGNEIQI